VLGTQRISRSLNTSSPREAKRLLRSKAHEIDDFFDDVRRNGKPTPSENVERRRAAPAVELTLRQAYEMFLSDASTARSGKTLLAYRTVSHTVMDILGGDVPLKSITRPQCRELLTKLTQLPLHARKRWPDRSALEAISLSEGHSFPRMSPAHVNGHLIKFSSLLNWASKEELISRNPALGLRILFGLATNADRSARISFEKSSQPRYFVGASMMRTDTPSPVPAGENGVATGFRSSVYTLVCG
jgi:hypothetical protein